ncbi:MAG: 4Fe-4S binding protein [Candidatus Nanoarchaeia archaeon]|nr:4Fe-4S binding protein [Candidatus Nanoarchaeia archaeon]MDD5054515.1 4Fe-4S binding protein [Candidatus Nanoarchaeia archaeon]MDD5499746.1 4Fe-4S binding protein [Candidatus Nanoarchaeia archaeon]
MIVVDYEKCCWKNGSCTGCSCGSKTCANGCVEACPANAITRKKILKIDKNKCIDCGACVIACKKRALKSA